MSHASTLPSSPLLGSGELLSGLAPTMLSFEDLMKKLQDCVLKDEHTREDVDQKLLLFVDKLSETSRFVVSSQHQ